MINLLLADDHEIVREGLSALINSNHSSFRIVEQATNGLDIFKKTEAYKPDVIIFDISISGIDGLEAVRQLVKSSPKTKIIILSMRTDDRSVISALQAGAKGYLTKKCGFKDLEEAILKVYAGSFYISDDLSERIVQLCINSQTIKDIPKDPYDTLTSREKEVLSLAAEGYTNAEIAERLFVSRRTVETHRARIMSKLSLHGHTELVRYAIERRLVVFGMPEMAAVPA